MQKFKIQLHQSSDQVLLGLVYECKWISEVILYRLLVDQLLH